MDISEGDLLSYGGTDYPIKACSDWTMPRQSAASFARMATLSVSTKRSTLSGTIRSTPAAYLTGLNATPFDPVSPELAATVELETPAELVQTFISDGSGFVRLLLEVLK